VGICLVTGTSCWHSAAAEAKATGKKIHLYVQEFELWFMAILKGKKQTTYFSDLP
jgi:hypothetical protein